MRKFFKVGAQLTGVALALVLTACGSSNGSAASSTGVASSGAVSDVSGSAASGAASGTASSTQASPTPAGPKIAAPTTIGSAVPASELPTAAGAYNSKPTLTFPKSNPPNTLQRKVLTQGTGATLAKGDFAVVNYIGEVWGGTKDFDNSYDKKATFTFQLGAGGVVPGWDVAMVGVKQGSRVLLSLPPSAGYGSAGQPSAGIKGTDTIVFVIDVVNVIPSTATGQANAVKVALPAGLPTVTGDAGKTPTVSIPSGLTAPSSSNAYIVYKGTGANVQEGKVIAQIAVIDWDGTNANSTWPSPTPTSAGADAADQSTKGAQEISVQSGSLTGKLTGIPVGSRVLLTIPASTDSSSGQSTPAEAAVIDIVAQESVGTS